MKDQRKKNNYLPVNVKSIEPEVFHKVHGCLSKLFASGVGGGCPGEVGRIGPSTNRKEHLEVAVLLLHKVEPLNAAIDIVSCVAPGIVRVMLFQIRVRVAEIHLASLRPDIGESVENVSNRANVQVLGLKVASIDCLRIVKLSITDAATPFLSSTCSIRTQLTK